MIEWTTANIPSQTGKLAIVTGATGGLGYEIALALAGAGAELILAARDMTKGERASRLIADKHLGAKVSFELLDLASLTSVADFVDRLCANGRHVDLMINNAGIMALADRRVSADNLELQFATNYLWHFALTAQLLPLLRGTHRARVVSMSSLVHRQGRIDVDDLQASRSYDLWKAYAQSKLAMLLFSTEPQRRSDANGWGLVSNAAHPARPGPN
ncbi:SDR family NAD(P)-dependent oxidoreductase [Paraburkholderia sediminicola]|uniref:SDR family NAD(P)-dependent oxidoreductase n=1 Tax=Paraburkholderia sediminicola TaxID=458836 RepID=UPI0038BD1941